MSHVRTAPARGIHRFDGDAAVRAGHPGHAGGPAERCPDGHRSTGPGSRDRLAGRNARQADARPGSRPRPSGASGHRVGRTGRDGSERRLVAPAALVAVTVNVYASPARRFLTVMGELLPRAEELRCPGCVTFLDVAVYPVTASEVLGVNETFALPLPAAAFTPVGGAGAGGTATPAGVVSPVKGTVRCGPPRAGTFTTRSLPKSAM